MNKQVETTRGNSHTMWPAAVAASRYTGSLLAVLSILLLSVSCADEKLDLWIEGLTLPPGSTVVSETLEGGSGSGRSGKTVIFNSNEDWKSVANHIRGCLVRAGFDTDPADHYSPAAYNYNNNEYGVTLFNRKEMQKGDGLPADGDYELWIGEW